jgi:hypothetical protein
MVTTIEPVGAVLVRIALLGLATSIEKTSVQLPTCVPAVRTRRREALGPPVALQCSDESEFHLVLLQLLRARRAAPEQSLLPTPVARSVRLRAPVLGPLTLRADETAGPVYVTTREKEPTRMGPRDTATV